MKKVFLFIFGFCLLGITASYASSATKTTHAIAMHGLPKYKTDFKHFAYVNPKAPKGGTLNLYAFGTFDNLNPFILKGMPAPGTDMLFDTLMVSSKDEPFTEYGLIAESIEVDSKRTFAAFNLRKEARFHDGSPLTADDVVFSFATLRDKGSPVYKFYYSGVKEVKATSPHRVVFTFKPEQDNRELPLILGQLPILSQKYWQDKDFAATTLQTPLGSGPYKIKSFEAGRRIVYERVKDYWAKDLPVNVGYNNFDFIKYDLYRDTTVALEAFKSGAIDLRIENEAKKWGKGYNFKAVNDGFAATREFRHHLPSGMQGFVFNTRREIFKDPKVRKALAYALDFEWSNKNLFFGLYHRTKSFFDNSLLSSGSALPDKEELKLLNVWKDKLPPEVFTKNYAPPTTGPDNPLRTNLLTALKLLQEAGWNYRNGRLENAKGEPFRFEIMLDSSGAAAWERITLPFVANLKKLGIEAVIRVVDLTQAQNRMNTFDFDMVVHVWGQSLSPGNEQRSFWSSAAADQNGSSNYAGVKDPAVDAMIEKVISASDDKELVTATKALDRILLWGHYVIPHWHSKETRIAYWNKFGMPETTPLQGVQLMSLWIDKDKFLRLQEYKQEKEAEK